MNQTWHVRFFAFLSACDNINALIDFGKIRSKRNKTVFEASIESFKGKVKLSSVNTVAKGRLPKKSSHLDGK